MRVLFASLLLVLSCSSLASAQGPSLVDVRADDDPERDVGGRIAVQLTASFGLVLGSSLATGLAVLYSDRACDATTCALPDGAAYASTAMAMLFSSLTSTLMITGIGEAMGGYGHLGTSFIGLGVSAAAAAAVVALGAYGAERLTPEPGLEPGLMISALTLGALVLATGPTVAYAIDDGDAPEVAPISVAPSFSVSAEGASVSLHGAF